MSIPLRERRPHTTAKGAGMTFSCDVVDVSVIGLRTLLLQPPRLPPGGVTGKVLLFLSTLSSAVGG